MEQADIHVLQHAKAGDKRSRRIRCKSGCDAVMYASGLFYYVWKSPANVQ